MCLLGDRLEGVLGSDDKMILEKEEAASEKQTKAELSQEGREREKSGQCRRPSLPSAAALSSFLSRHPSPTPGQLWASGPGCCVVIDEP